MTFQDFILDQKLQNYETDQTQQSQQGQTNSDDSSSSTPRQINLDEVKNSGLKLIDSLLSKERFIETKKNDHDVKVKNFYDEFPRKQSNTDSQYHHEDVTMKFIVDWFFGKK